MKTRLDTLYHAADEAAGLIAAIDRAAKRLHDLMEQAHGGRMRVDINHEHGFALVVSHKHDAITKPRKGEVA